MNSLCGLTSEGGLTVHFGLSFTARHGRRGGIRRPFHAAARPARGADQARHALDREDGRPPAGAVFGAAADPAAAAGAVSKRTEPRLSETNPGSDSPCTPDFAAAQSGLRSLRCTACDILPSFARHPAMTKSSVVRSDPDILGGTPVFVGTRVPVQALIDYIEAGHALQEFLDDFPSVTRELAVAALEQAKAHLIADARAA